VRVPALAREKLGLASRVPALARLAPVRKPRRLRHRCDHHATSPNSSLRKNGLFPNAALDDNPGACNIPQQAGGLSFF